MCYTQDAERQVLAFVHRYTDDTTRHHLAGLGNAVPGEGLLSFCFPIRAQLASAGSCSQHQQCAGTVSLTIGWHAGSSVHVDLTFLRKDMPQLAAHLPYRVVVSAGIPQSLRGDSTVWRS